MPVLFSRACEYALRGLAEMALHPDKKYWTIQDLAKETETPAPFLAKTFQILVRHKVLLSTKGRKGGFSLIGKTNELSILDIVHIIDGPALSQDCALGFSECSNDTPCAFHEQWKPLREDLVRALSEKSLEQFAKQRP